MGLFFQGTFHDVEIADSGDGCSLICTCGESFDGDSWEAAGKRFDDHINEIAVAVEGET